MNDETFRPHSEAYDSCTHELQRPVPDYQAAQVYALLSVEEALRDLADKVAVAIRQRR